MTVPSLAIFDGIGTMEFVALVILGILLYGKNLPTVARTIGRTVGEFRRHMRDVENQIQREAFHDEMRTMRERLTVGGEKRRPMAEVTPAEPKKEAPAAGPESKGGNSAADAFPGTGSEPKGGNGEAAAPPKPGPEEKPA